MGSTGGADDIASLVALERSGWWVPSGKVIVVTLLGVLTGVLLAATAWAAHYQPLTEHGGGWEEAGRLPDPGFRMLRPGMEITNAYGTEHRLTGLKPGERIGLVFGLNNNGPFPVQVTAVGAPLHESHVTDVQAFHSVAPDNFSTPYRPLEPFTLRPGEARSVAVAVVLGCRWPTAADRGEQVDSVGSFPIPVTYRFLGVSHTAEIPLPFALTLRDVTFC